jgi:hypothetical protein
VAIPPAKLPMLLASASKLFKSIAATSAKNWAF